MGRIERTRKDHVVKRRMKEIGINKWMKKITKEKRKNINQMD